MLEGLKPSPLIGTNLAAFNVFFLRDRNATDDATAMLYAGFASCDCGSMEYILRFNVETDGNTAAFTLVTSMASNLVVVGVSHGKFLLRCFCKYIIALRFGIVKF